MSPFPISEDVSSETRGAPEGRLCCDVVVPFASGESPPRRMFGRFDGARRVDAAEMGIRNRDAVRVTSRRGTLVLEARIDYRAQPTRGQVFIPFFDEGLLVNELTIDAYCPISKQPDYKKCAVRVERV